MNSNSPLATIMIITYNHAPFIGAAIDSVLNQKTNFPFNIHVIEDCSTDGTQDILLDYERKHPEKIKLFMNSKNIGFKVTQKNFIRGFKTLRAKYIAVLEGDDLWCYDGKLQHQVDFLEINSDFVGHAHNTIKFYDKYEMPSHRFLYNENIKSVHDVHDFIKIQSFFHTTTILYRNVLKDRVPRQFINPLSCDIFNTIAHAQHGKIRYINADWARYRVHSGGMFSGMSGVKGWFFNIDGLRKYNEWLSYRYLPTFCESIIKYCAHVLKQEKLNNCTLSYRQKIKLFTLLGIYKTIFTVINFLSIPKRVLNSICATKSGIDLNEFDYTIINQV